MPTSHSPFRSQPFDYPPNQSVQLSRKKSSTRTLREIIHSDPRDARANGNIRKRSPAPAAKQRISSSRILNEDGSIPRTTDELIIRGFEKLKDEKRRRENRVHLRDISDGSSKSSATYVGSFADYSTRPDILQSGGIQPGFSHDNDSSSRSADRQNRVSTTTETQDTGSRSRMSLERHEAKIRAMEAEISAITRAATLTRELRSETHGRSSQLGANGINDNIRRETKRSICNEVLMSGGNGENNIQTNHPHSLQNTHTTDESMDGMPTPPQLLPVEFKQHHPTQSRESRRSHRKQEKRQSSREKLCLCPNCISVTQQVVNSLVARYSMQSKEENSRIQNYHHPNQVEQSPRKSKSLYLDPKSYTRHHHTTSQASVNTPLTDSKTIQHRKSLADVSSRPHDTTGKENFRPEFPSPNYLQYQKGLKAAS